MLAVNVTAWIDLMAASGESHDTSCARGSDNFEFAAQLPRQELNELETRRPRSNLLEVEAPPAILHGQLEASVVATQLDENRNLAGRTDPVFHRVGQQLV